MTKFLCITKQILCEYEFVLGAAVIIVGIALAEWSKV